MRLVRARMLWVQFQAQGLSVWVSFPTSPCSFSCFLPQSKHVFGENWKLSVGVCVWICWWCGHLSRVSPGLHPMTAARDSSKQPRVQGEKSVYWKWMDSRTNGWTDELNIWFDPDWKWSFQAATDATLGYRYAAGQSVTGLKGELLLLSRGRSLPPAQLFSKVISMCLLLLSPASR